jgi:transcriptional regulator with XRE-family HTH domain
MKVHWTERSIKDYLFRIAADFIGQLEDKMEMSGINQDKLAKILNVTKGWVSQVFNRPGNITIETMVKYARSLGMKVSIVAYEDDDPENKKGPINPEVFKICWERAGSPRDFWELQETPRYAATYINTTATQCTLSIKGAIPFPGICLFQPVTSGNVSAEWADIFHNLYDIKTATSSLGEFKEYGIQRYQVSAQ